MIKGKVRHFSKRFVCFESVAFSMAVLMIYSISQKISSKRYIMCGLGSIVAVLQKVCFFPHRIERVKSFTLHFTLPSFSHTIFYKALSKNLKKTFFSFLHS